MLSSRARPDMYTSVDEAEDAMAAGVDGCYPMRIPGGALALPSPSIPPWAPQARVLDQSSFAMSTSSSKSRACPEEVPKDIGKSALAAELDHRRTIFSLCPSQI